MFSIWKKYLDIFCNKYKQVLYFETLISDLVFVCVYVRGRFLHVSQYTEPFGVVYTRLMAYFFLAAIVLM
jgi:uncharacterized membrane protein